MFGFFGQHSDHDISSNFIQTAEMLVFEIDLAVTVFFYDLTHFPTFKEWLFEETS